jgi:hypothetical protein
MTSLNPPRESLVVTSRLGRETREPFFYGVCADGFRNLSKAFHYPIQLLTFFLILEITNFEMLAETLLRIPVYVIGRCSLVPTSHWLLGNVQELTYHKQLPV